MASFPFRYTLQNAGGRMNHEMESLAKSHPFSCFFFFMACGDGTPNKDDKTIVEGLGNW